MTAELRSSQFNTQEEKYLNNGPYHREVSPFNRLNRFYNDGLSRLNWALPDQNLENKNILDFGGGDGAMASRIQDFGAQVTISDLSPSALLLAQSADPRLNLVRSTAQLPFAPESFDGITMLEVIEHMEDDEATLQELYKVMKTGAPIVLSAPSTKIPVAPTHFRHYTFEGFETLLANNGLTVVDAIGYKPFKSPSSNKNVNIATRRLYSAAAWGIYETTGTNIDQCSLDKAEDYLITAVKK